MSNHAPLGELKHLQQSLSPEGILTLTINRPEALNALNPGVLQSLLMAMAKAAVADDVKIVVLTGAGEKSFVAGADISAMEGMNAMQAKAFADMGHGLGDSIRSLEKVVIAAVNGFALGGGCELAMSCDMIFASEKAKFGQPEVNLGVIPGFGGTQRLSRLVGLAKAKELIFTGAPVDAQTAKSIGLVNDVFPVGELLDRVYAIAKTILSKSPVAIGQAKRCMNAGYHMDLPSANELEKQTFATLFATEDQKEGMRAFLEKRPAKFPGK